MVLPEPAQHQLDFCWACMAMSSRLAAAATACAGGVAAEAVAPGSVVSAVSAVTVSAAADSRLRRARRAWGARVMAFLPDEGGEGVRGAHPDADVEHRVLSHA